MKLLTIDLPQYNLQQEPDAKEIGRIIDDQIREEFMGKTVVVRGVASSAHPGKTLDELIDIISRTGTDRYDPNRAGDRYQNIENRHIDFFGVSAIVSSETNISQTIIWGFYYSAIEVYGSQVKIDVIIIYDANQLDQVMHQYEGRDDIKDDGFAFKHPDKKTKAILGIIKIT